MLGRVLAVGAAALALTGCVSTPSSHPASAPIGKDGIVSELKSFPPPGVALRGTRWRLVSMAGHDSLDGLAERPDLILQDGSSGVAGFAGCNRYFGTYRLHERQLSFASMGVTKRLCDHRANQVEMAFLAALDATQRLQKAGSQLSLLDASGKTLLRFEADPAQTRLLPSSAGEGALAMPGSAASGDTCPE